MQQRRLERRVSLNEFILPRLDPMEIKPYEKMWYLFTFWDEPTIYPLPYAAAEKIMHVINAPNPPKYIDLKNYGYWRESASMIRGCREYVWDDGEIEWIIMQLPYEQKQKVKQFIAERKSNNLITTWSTIKKFLSI